jgi:hypothetical protein
MIWWIFGIVYGIQILLTIRRFMTTCQSLTLLIWFIYFIHHALDVFLFWSFLFISQLMDYWIHILIVLIVAIHWFMNNNQCIATVFMNQECGYPEDEWLDSLKNMFGLRNISEYFQFYWIGILLIYDIYKILQ